MAVCLLWSIVNPRTSCASASCSTSTCPGVPFTLSHQLNPSLREYRRASSTCIDASLKPVMTRVHRRASSGRLRDAGFARPGPDRHLVGRRARRAGRRARADPLAQLRPVDGAGRRPALRRAPTRQPRRRSSPTPAARATTSAWCAAGASRGRARPGSGRPYFGHMTGLPVGRRAQRRRRRRQHRVGRRRRPAARRPGERRRRSRARSATAPAATRPTVTDACVVLGYIDPDYFLGGRAQLDVEAARAAIRAQVAEPLGPRRARGRGRRSCGSRPSTWSARSRRSRSTRASTRARRCSSAAAARPGSTRSRSRAGSAVREVIIPPIGPALSAAGALISDLARSFAMTFRTTDAASTSTGSTTCSRSSRSRRASSSTDRAQGAIASRIEFSRRGPLPAPGLGARVAGALRRGSPARRTSACCARTSTPSTARSSRSPTSARGSSSRAGTLAPRCQLREPVEPAGRASVPRRRPRHARRLPGRAGAGARAASGASSRVPLERGA